MTTSCRAPLCPALLGEAKQGHTHQGRRQNLYALLCLVKPSKATPIRDEGRKKLGAEQWHRCARQAPAASVKAQVWFW